MTAKSTFSLTFVRANLYRATSLGLAYGLSLAVILVSVVILKRSDNPTVLGKFLLMIFIASIAAGIEPGTVKSVILTLSRDQFERLLNTRHFVRSCATATAIKTVLFAPVLALIWLLINKVDTPIITIILSSFTFTIIGFSATEIRTAYDYVGKFSQAVLVKQGNMSFGVAIATMMYILHFSELAVIFAYILARILFTFLTAKSILAASDGALEVTDKLALVANAHWKPIMSASVIGAMSGSIDRVTAFYFLSAAQSASFFVLYEFVSKFWLLPYLLAPITFATIARGDGKQFLAFARSTIFLAGLAVFMLAYSFASWRVFGSLWEQWSPNEVEVLVAAVVLASFTQVEVARLQGGGNSNQSLAVSAIGAVTALLLFPALTFAFGAQGLVWAWFGKSVAELIVAFPYARKGLPAYEF